MEKPCLNDKNVRPDDEVLSRCLGRAKATWDSFLTLLAECDPAISGEWRYYTDGKSWLYKVTKKKKTVCWVSVWAGAFRATFYFADKAEDLIVGSKLKAEYIDQFVQGKRYGKIRGVTVVARKSTDLKAIRTLIDIKQQLK
ncbi:MAG TPA: DUF3788 family protein [Sedimentisphaerales bacterium]|jgi:hypothetical protein|nr:DUF3788 family protein [Sedimentisphaerales bacterium]HQN35433.1 DUF3788 family protein [Sedimentisphaerales bacterium]